MIRLDKYLAQSTDYSRSDVKRLIKLSAVSINNKIASGSGEKINPENDIIFLEGKQIQALKPRYFMVHKPKKMVCANHDSQHPTVIDLLNEPQQHTLQIVGRLDKDTTGLVLITDDGQWNHRVTAPTRACAKVYEVIVQEPLTKDLIELFAAGILLKSEAKPTLPAELNIINEFTAELTIQEGKYHQVKRMFAAVNNHVIELHRKRIGPIILDPDLASGKYRSLTLEEINYFTN
ncbi:MAG: 16S rRNA pseudouridine516 synthase [Cellvibrionaceae bacterium]|jgi:16S rRNA pseudouridine516 synthase